MTGLACPALRGLGHPWRATGLRRRLDPTAHPQPRRQGPAALQAQTRSIPWILLQFYNCWRHVTARDSAGRAETRFQMCSMRGRSPPPMPPTTSTTSKRKASGGAGEAAQVPDGGAAQRLALAPVDGGHRNAQRNLPRVFDLDKKRAWPLPARPGRVRPGGPMRRRRFEPGDTLCARGRRRLAARPTGPCRAGLRRAWPAAV